MVTIYRYRSIDFFHCFLLRVYFYKYLCCFFEVKNYCNNINLINPINALTIFCIQFDTSLFNHS